MMLRKIYTCFLFFLFFFFFQSFYLLSPLQGKPSGPIVYSGNSFSRTNPGLNLQLGASNQSFSSLVALYRQFENIELGSEAFAVGCFLQDSQGMIWFGSDRGLFSYNGYSIQSHFTSGEQSNTRIHCGITLGQDTLILGGDKGILIYECRSGRYAELPVTFPSNVRALALQGDVLWIGTLNGLYTYRFSSRTLRQFAPEHYPDLPHTAIYTIACSDEKSVYIGTYNGLCRYTSDQDRFSVIPLTFRNRNNQFVNSLLIDSLNHCLWVGTDGCLFQHSFETGKTVSLDSFSDNTIKTLALDREGNLLAGTDNGLYIHTPDRRVQHIVHDSRNQHSLSNNIIWNIFTDREGNVWLGTDWGISLSRYNTVFSYLPISQITGTGEGNQFYTLLKDTRGNLWLGGTNGLIRTSSFKSGKPDVTWYKMTDKTYHLAHNRVRDIYEDSTGEIWVTTDGSLHRYDRLTQRFIHYNITDSTGMYNANWAYQMFEDTSGKLWIAAYLGGVFVVDKQQLLNSTTGNCVAERNFSVRNGLAGMYINQLVADKDDHLWVLFYNDGIDKINIHTHTITHITTPVENIDCLLCDSEGFIWGGFEGGVVRIHPKGDHPVEVLRFGPFGNNSVRTMLEVEGYIWASTTNGIWVIDRQTKEARRMMWTDQTFSSMYYFSPEKQVYLGGVDGLILTSPDAHKHSTLDLPVYLTSLYINNRRIESLGKNSIRYADKIEVDYHQNNLSFEFSDLSYSQEKKALFVYRLDGADREWNMLKPNTNRIIYSNLSSGDYRLLISKLDSKGEPSALAYSLPVSIRFPWYATWWARSLYALMLIGLVTWIINFYRVKLRLKREHAEKEKILEQSRQKMEFFTHLSHDLKTPLSLIIAPISKLLPQVKNQREKHLLENVHRNAMKMNQLIHQIVELNRIENDSNTILILSQVEFAGFARTLLETYKEAGQEKNLTLLFHTNREKIFINIDVIKWESILGNLLSNALKYTPEGGTISLSIQVLDQQLSVCISDTGIGIPVQEIPYIFQRFFQSSRTAGNKEGTGIGLYLVKTYVELHGGTVTISSEDGNGTTVSILLPVPITTELAPSAEDASSPNVLSGLPVIPEQEAGIGPDSPVAGTESPLILIVDDNREIVSFIEEILRTAYRCCTASNGKEGLEMCMEHCPDLVIADLMMPVMNGLEMARAIRKHVPTSTVPIVLLTAKSDKETELESIRLHIDAFIPKPFEPDLLLSRIEQLLGRRQTWETKTRLEILATPEAIEATSFDEKFLADIIRLIEDHVADSDLNVNALCELSGISNKQMYRKLKQLTGMTPVEYIKSIRMKKAMMLLEQRKFTVAEVMYMVGFSNHSYFSKCFQTAFGKTPKQFMEDK